MVCELYLCLENEVKNEIGIVDELPTPTRPLAVAGEFVYGNMEDPAK